MYSIQELTSHARAQARKMGLNKVVDVRINPQLRHDGTCYSTSFSHEIQLKCPRKIVVEHEIGHAYIDEKLPRLSAFFGIAGIPYRALGSVFKLGYLLTTVGAGITGYLIDSPVLQIAPLTNLVYGPAITEELMAFYFGRKYRPDMKDRSL